MLRAAFLGVIVALATACGGDDFTPEQKPPAKPCNEDPWSCPAGQTCWLDDTGKKYECLNQGTAAAGEACTLFVGSPTCQAGLFCLSVQGSMMPPICAPFCDTKNPKHACATGTCGTLMGEGGDVHVCEP